MKKMRTLLKSFSLAALFSLATACAVDPDAVDSEQSEALDDAAVNPENLDEATAEAPARNHDGRAILDIPTRGFDKLEQPYCEQSYDCESEICDQSINRCRDYPF